MENRIKFLNDIKIDKKEDEQLLKLQQKFENNESDLAIMSNEEIHNLNQLYARQINKLKKKIDNKKTELNITKHRIKRFLGYN